MRAAFVSMFPCQKSTCSMIISWWRRRNSPREKTFWLERGARAAEDQEVAEVDVPELGELPVGVAAQRAGAGERELRLRLPAGPRHDGVEVVEGVGDGVVHLVVLVVDPPPPERRPVGDGHHLLFPAVEEDELPLLDVDGRQPVAPLLHAEEDRNPAPEVAHQLGAGVRLLVAPDHQQVAVELPRRAAQLQVVGAVPPVGAGELADFPLVLEDAEGHQGVLEREGAALPDVGLWVYSHVRSGSGLQKGKRMRE